MHRYFVSYSVKTETHSGFIDSVVDISGPIDSSGDINLIRESIAEMKGYEPKSIVVLNFILLSVSNEESE